TALLDEGQARQPEKGSPPLERDAGPPRNPGLQLEPQEAVRRGRPVAVPEARARLPPAGARAAELTRRRADADPQRGCIRRLVVDAERVVRAHRGHTEGGGVGCISWKPRPEQEIPRVGRRARQPDRRIAWHARLAAAKERRGVTGKHLGQ